MKTVIVTLLIVFGLSGCATLERFVDDVYDGDPRMTEIKERVDELKAVLETAVSERKQEFQSRLEILREEAEMLGDLKQAEFEIKLQEMKAQLEIVSQALAK